MAGTFQGIRGSANGLASLDSNGLVPLSQLGALSIKNSCQVATTANITLSGLQLIDGYTTLAGDRVLVKNQTTNTQNGIYIASSSAWTRSSDFSSTGDQIAGAFTFIENGTVQDNSGWLCSTPNSPTPVIGTTAITFIQFSGSGLYGTVTSVSVVSANGLSGSVATPTTTPSITLSPSFTGISYSNGTGFAAAIAANFPTLNQNTTGNAATATTATNLAGGAQGSLPYQTASGSTTFLANGSGVLIGGTTPSYSLTPSLTSATLTATSNQIISNGNNFTIPQTSNSNAIIPLSSATANRWVAYVDSTGTQNLTQPAFSNISGIATIAQGGTNSGTALSNNSLMYSSGGKIVELGNATNGQIAIGSTSGAPVLATLTGTANQVNIANSSGGITLSLPQSIATTSTPTFAQGTISNTPVNPTDIANKSYVDSIAQGLDAKASCQVATTANITLSGLQTLDGYTTLVGDRVLVKNQTNNIQNGIYIASNSAWTRSADFAAGTNQRGAFTFIENGTTQNTTGWVCSLGVNVGTTATVFVQFSAAGTYNAGTGLTLTGTTFSLNNSTTTSLGGVIVPASGNLSIDGSGNISVPVSTSSTLGVSSPDNTTITATAGIYAAVTATTGVKGIVKPDGTTVTISAGTISVPTGSASAQGILQVGSNINVSSGTISIPQSVATSATPTFASQTLSSNTNQLTLGTSNTTTLTMASLTASRVVTFPNANSNTIVPSTAASNQFATGISSGGVISYAQPQQQNIKINVLSKSANYTISATDNKIVLTANGLTIQLPLVASASIGQEYTIQLYNVATGTLIPNSGDTGVTINGLSSVTMSPFYGSFTVYTPDNLQWLLA